MKNILVTIDFDDSASFLIEKAYNFGLAFNAKIWLLHVAAPDPDFVGNDVGPQSVRDSRAEKLRKEHRQLQEYAKILTDKDIDAEALLIQGSTIEMIIEESRKLYIDLIIAGHQEHGFFHKAIIGSVSNKIIQKSKIPVLIVPVE